MAIRSFAGSGGANTLALLSQQNLLDPTRQANLIGRGLTGLSQIEPERQLQELMGGTTQANVGENLGLLSSLAAQSSQPFQQGVTRQLSGIDALTGRDLQRGQLGLGAGNLQLRQQLAPIGAAKDIAQTQAIQFKLGREQEAEDIIRQANQFQKALAGAEGTDQNLKELGISPEEVRQAKATLGLSVPSASGRRDRLAQIQEAKRLSEDPALSPEERDFFKQVGTTFIAGTGATAEEFNEQQLAQDAVSTQGFKDQGFATAGATIPPFVQGEMKSVENRNFNNTKGTPAGRAAQSSIDLMKGNHLMVNNIQDVLNLDTQGKLDKIDKGIWGNTVQAAQRLMGGGFTSEQTESMNQQINLDTRLGRMIAQYIKSISGAAATDVERTFLQDLMTSGKYADENAMWTAVQSFQGSLKDENENIAGQVFDFAPDSATKFRDYKETPQQTQQRFNVGDTSPQGAVTEAEGEFYKTADGVVHRVGG